MAANATQIADLINRLWARTEAGSLTWEQFGGGFQCRLSDFVVALSKTSQPFGGIAGATQSVAVNVKRLDGRPVLHATTGAVSNALNPFSATQVVSIPLEAQRTLEQLFRHLSTRDTDLDELLKQL